MTDTISSRWRKQPLSLTSSPYVGERHDTKWTKVLVWIVAAALVFFGIWAALTPIYEVVSGRGEIRPEGLSTRIEHPEGGAVAEIFVTEGDTVVAGQTLLTLERGGLLAERRKLEARLARLERSIARYETLVETDLSRIDRPRLEEMLRQDDPSFREEVSYRFAQLDALANEGRLAEAQREVIAERRARRQRELDILRTQRARLGSDRARGVIPLVRLEEIDGDIARLEAAISELDGEGLVQETMLSRTETDRAALVAEYRLEAANLLEKQREEQISTRESLAQVSERLERTEITSPRIGIIQGLSVQHSGEVVAAGEQILEIIPVEARAFAEIEVPADRIGGVETGQEASVKVLTHDFTRYGDITAHVARISPSSFVREDGTSVFNVKLALNPESAAALTGPRRAIGPGMTVVADVKSSRSTVLAYLLRPLRLISNRALTEA